MHIHSALLWMLFTTVKMCLCGYGKSVCYQVLPFIMDYKHGVVEMQRHSLVLIVSLALTLRVNRATMMSRVTARGEHRLYSL